MINPFRSEAEAYRFLWLTVAYFALIVVGSVINRWLGLGIFVGLTAAAVVWYVLHRERAEPRQTGTTRPASINSRRILVIANETVGGETLRDCISKKTEGFRAEVLVVSPALNTPLRHWVSDEDGARDAARARLERSLGKLRDGGLDARGEVGDGEPLQAIEDAVRTFGPDEIIISTHPEGRSHWLEKGVVTGAKARFTVPVTHVVVDLDDEREQLA